MHITAPRVLGFLMFLGLIGYTFFVGPWINTTASTYSPASSKTTTKAPAATTKAAPSSKSVPSDISHAALQLPGLPGTQLPAPLIRSWTD